MAKTFEMLIKADEKSSVFDDKLISQVDGNTRAGWVFNWYCRIANPANLSLADASEVREKRTVAQKTNSDGTVVTQYINQVNDYGYYLETKLEHPKSEAVELVNNPISKACYNHLALIAEVSYPFERKRMPAAENGLFYEVDVFLTPGGAKHPWVKVTLFTPDLSLEIPKLPFKCLEYIIDIPGEITPESKRFINDLWETQYFYKQPQWMGTGVKLDYNVKRVD